MYKNGWLYLLVCIPRCMSLYLRKSLKNHKKITGSETPRAVKVNSKLVKTHNTVFPFVMVHCRRDRLMKYEGLISFCLMEAWKVWQHPLSIPTFDVVWRVWMYEVVLICKEVAKLKVCHLAERWFDALCTIFGGFLTPTIPNLQKNIKNVDWLLV